MIGERVAELRRGRGWEQDDLAAKAGVSQSTVSRVETGARRAPSSETMRRLARALGVPVDALYPDSADAVDGAAA